MRAGELVQLADVPVVGQRGDRDVGDVLGVDERLRSVPGRERDLALQHEVAEVVLAEVKGRCSIRRRIAGMGCRRPQPQR
jgi:hypothetical protein